MPFATPSKEGVVKGDARAPCSGMDYHFRTLQVIENLRIQNTAIPLF